MISSAALAAPPRTSPTPPAPAGAAKRDEAVEPYRVGPGDVLKVDVAGRTDLTGAFAVSPEGNLQLPVLGTVPAENRTLAELTSDLSRRISLFDRSNPQVTISVQEYKSRKVFVLGAVVLPGIYAFSEMPSVWDAIAEAGGPVEDGDLSAVELIPGDQAGGRTATTVDVASAIREGRSETLPKLRPGDTVRVPRGRTASTISVFGAVLHPGPLPVDQAPDLLSAVMKSGGPAVDAQMGRVVIVRTTGTRVLRMHVNLQDYLTRAEDTGNPPLEPGDMIYVDRLSTRKLNFFTLLGTTSSLIGLAASLVALSRTR
jgi:polysaccharide export outer membrane protein